MQHKLVGNCYVCGTNQQEMIKNVHVENFRCFKSSDFQGFKQINLIGGKNNSGKTAFLEALFLGTSPRTRSIELLREFRQIDSSFSKEMPEIAWDNLFLDKENKNSKIAIESHDNDYYELLMSCDKSVEDFVHILSDDEIGVDENDKKFQEIRELLSNRESTKSTLHLKYSINGKEDVSCTLIAHNQGVIGKDFNIPDIKNVTLIPSSYRVTTRALAQEFDKADLKGESEKVLEAFQIIDPEIKEVKTISVGKPSVYIKTRQNEFLPIGLFGDAINKVSFFILKMINNRNSILLIDEIENGIHYSSQISLWENIFKVAQKFDVQIFATTHSIEMIKAFSTVVGNNNYHLGDYFEFFRHRKTGEVASNAHDPNTLSFELDNDMAIRG